MGLKLRLFILTTEAENKQRCPCSQETKEAKRERFIYITFGIPLSESMISHLITKLNQKFFFLSLHQNKSVALNFKRAELNVLQVLRPIFIKTILHFISVLQRSTPDSMVQLIQRGMLNHDKQEIIKVMISCDKLSQKPLNIPFTLLC